MRWLYAAYHKGTFDAPTGMEPATFREWVVEQIASVGNGEVYILTSPFAMDGKIIDRPVGVVLGQFSKHRMEPSVWWFPWATPRNKIECAVKFLATMRFTNVVLIAAEKADWPFYQHLLRYGMLHKVGVIQDYFGEGKNAKFYQTRGFAGVP